MFFFDENGWSNVEVMEMRKRLEMIFIVEK